VNALLLKTVGSFTLAKLASRAMDTGLRTRPTRCSHPSEKRFQVHRVPCNRDKVPQRTECWLAGQLADQPKALEQHIGRLNYGP
jgi:hypothetical protein